MVQLLHLCINIFFVFFCIVLYCIVLYVEEHTIYIINSKALFVKATSHSTIVDIPMRPMREDQRHRQRFTR